MKQKIKTIAWAIIIVVIAFIYAHIAKAHNVYNLDIDPSEYRATGILTETGVTQEFVSQEEHLDAVKVKTTIFTNCENVKLNYSIVDAESQKVLAEGKKSCKKVKNSKFFELDFKRITNCKNKKLELKIYSEGQTIDTGVGFSYEPTNENGTKLMVNGQDTEGTLVVKTITHRFDVETFVMFIAFILYIIVFLKILYKLFK